MLMPSIFGENLFDDFFDYPFVKNEAESNGLMKTDVKDTEHGYEITMNLPGEDHIHLHISCRLMGLRYLNFKI